MNATSYEIDAARQLQEIPPDQVVTACRKKDARVWLDLEGATPEEIGAWLDRLDVHGLARRICLETGDRSGFYPLRKEMILVAPVLVGTGTETVPESDHVIFFCREQILVTIHRQPALESRDQLTLEEAAEWLPERTIASLVAAVLLDVTQTGLTRTTTLRQTIDALDDRLDRDPDSVQADDILDLRAILLAHELVISELRSGFQMHFQDKTNRRLGMLTSLSAIFMPITLMAWIWGMNFESMPELGFAYGYPLALGGMLPWRSACISSSAAEDGFDSWIGITLSPDFESRRQSISQEGRQ